VPKPATRRPGRPTTPALDRDRILRAALELIDEGGLGVLTMRGLATALDVDPMSIYHHVAGKDALIAGVIDLVLEDAPLVVTVDGDWRSRVRAWAVAYRAFILEHPSLVLDLLGDPVAASRLAGRSLEPLYAALDDAGLAPLAVVESAETLVDLIHGMVLAEAAQRPAPTFDRTSLLTDLDDDARSSRPTTVRLLEGLPVEQREYRFDIGFERALDLLIAGIATQHQDGSRSDRHA
jgi:TetR/AcrR family transcriptional regulator, tetracycline repressor protein